jgi:RHS repeat-associated protein
MNLISASNFSHRLIGMSFVGGMLLGGIPNAAFAQSILPPVCEYEIHLDTVAETLFCFDICDAPYNPPLPCEESEGECCHADGGAGGPGGGGPGGGSGACGGHCSLKGAGGMPHWAVNEPYLNLFLQDKPMWYQPSRGRAVEFKLYYKNTPSSNSTVDASQYLIFGVGTNWNTPWRSYLQSAYFESGRFMRHAGNGGVSHVAVGYVDRETSALFGYGPTNDTYQMTFSDGSRHVYGPKVTLAGTDLWFLSRMEDPQSNAITFAYTVTNNTIRLNKVIDADSRETTFQYTNSAYYSHLISQVTGPDGRTVELQYDSQSRLTNLIDAVQLGSGMAYDSSNRISRLVTPYGTNQFDYFASGTDWSAIRVTELSVRQHLFLEGDGPTNLFSTAVADILSLSNYLAAAGITTNRLAANNLHQRNTYYWGPRQYASLSSTVLTNLANSTFAISNVTTNDYNKGRTRHWIRKGLPFPDNTMMLGRTFSLERQPGPLADGSREGIIRFHDYQFDSNGNDGQELTEGFTKHPRVTAFKLPGAEWQVECVERQWNGLPLKRRSNYGPPGAVAWRTTVYEYGANKLDLTRVIENGVIVTTNEYNSIHQVTNSRNALNETTVYAYDAQQRLSTVTHPNGLVTTYTYDGSAGLPAAVVDSYSGTGLRTNSYTYTNGLVRTHTDPRGLTITNTYDTLNRLLRQDFPDHTAIVHSYDKLDRVKTLDRLGFTNGFAYDGFQQMIRHTNANKAVTTYNYCNCGSLDSVSDALNNSTTYTYDNAGYRTRVTHPGGSYEDLFYDTAGRVVRMSDNLGVSVTNFFTVNGLVHTASNAFGRVFLHTFDDHDRTISSIDHNGRALGFRFDDTGRLLGRTNRMVYDTPEIDLHSWEDHFDYTNNIRGPVAAYRAYTLITDLPIEWPEFTTTNVYRLGELVRYDYDRLGRKTSEVHWDTNDLAVMTNAFAYNAGGDLIQLTDGKAQTTTWKYDQYGRVTNKLDATSAELFRYTYDANSRLTTRWTPKGTTAYSYDAMGNPTLINYPGSPDITLHYDDLNRVTNMLDAVGTTRYGYTVFGALQSEDGPWDDDTVTNSYTANRLRSGLNLAQPNATAWAQSYAYDAASRLTNITSPAGAFGYSYAPVGADSTPSHLIRKLTLPGGSAFTNQFDEQARHVGTWLRNSGGTLLNAHTYDYNDLDQRIKQTRMVETSSTSSVDYGYDTLGQLVDATGKEGDGTTNRLHEQFGYAYDAAGNLNYRTNNGLVQTFNVNSLNGLTAVERGSNFTLAGFTTIPATNVTVNGAMASRYADNTFAQAELALLNGSNTFTAVARDSAGRVDTNVLALNLPASNLFAYDANGNLTTNGTRHFQYDDENQLICITEPGAWMSTNIYDGKMRRRIRKEFEWRNGGWVGTTERRYVYDGNLVLQERNEFNLPTVTYTRGLDLSGSLQGAGGIGGLLAMSQHSTTPTTHSYYHADGNGNVTMLIYSNQTVAAKYLYDPFGNTLAASGPLAEANLYRFSSKELHPASAFVYYLYRYYAPDLQRWLNRDPINEQGGINLYAAAESDLINYTDPLGLAVIVIPGKPRPGTPPGTFVPPFVPPGQPWPPVSTRPHRRPPQPEKPTRPKNLNPLDPVCEPPNQPGHMETCERIYYEPDSETGTFCVYECKNLRTGVKTRIARTGNDCNRDRFWRWEPDPPDAPPGPPPRELPKK